MDLNKAQGKVRNACITGIVINGLLLINALFSYLRGERLVLVLILVSCVFVASGLTFGTYKRSRICVIAMFLLPVMFLGNFMYMMRQAALTKEPFGDGDWMLIVLIIIVLYFFFEGIRGTFVYHKLMRNNPKSL